MIWTEKDIDIPGRPGLSLGRTYNSNDPRSGAFGNGWSTGCEVGLYQVTDTIQGTGGAVVTEKYYVYRTANGKRYPYKKDTSGNYAPPGKLTNTLTENSDGTVSLTEENGSSRTFNASGALIREASPAGQALSYSYDGNGRLTQIADNAGRSLNLTYNLSGRVSAVSTQDGTQWQYAYDASGNLTAVTNPDGGTRNYEYLERDIPGDAQDYYLLTKVVDEAGVTATEVTYVSQSTKVSSYTVGANRFIYSYLSDTSVSKRDSTGVSWNYQLNDKGEITQETAPTAGGSVIADRFAYDENGNITVYTDPLGYRWESTYDAQNRRLSAKNPAGDTITWEYEAGSALFSPTKATSPLGRVTTAKYNSHGNITEVTDPAGGKTIYTWNAEGFLTSVTDPLGNTQSFTLNAAGLPVTVTDADGKKTELEYDSLGNITGLINNAGEKTSLTYNALRQPLTVTDPSGATTTYARDAAGKITSVTDPAGNTTSYTYDTFGRLSTRTTADGKQTVYTYRADNLISSVTRPDGTQENYAYDNAKRLTQRSLAGVTTTFSYNANHELTQAAGLSSTVSFEYDNVGRLTAEIQSFTGVRLDYTYNKEGERTGTSFLGKSLSYDWGSQGMVSRISAPEGNFSFTHDGASRRTMLDGPETDVSYTYNSANQLTQQAFTGNFSEQYDYTYNANGLITGISNGGDIDGYAYNGDGFLTDATINGQNFTYQYDSAGNRIGNGEQYNDDNQLTEDNNHTFTYDGRGNLTRKQDKVTGAKTEFTWNGANQLVTVKRFADGTATAPYQTVNYSYDPLGRRLSRSDGTTTEHYAYDGYDRVATLDQSNTVVTTVTFGPQIDEPLAFTQAGGDSFYLHRSQQGSVIGATSNGSLAAEYDYSPYGESLNAPADIGNPFRYASREYEADDLYHYRARYYDPTLGRFISQDPLGIAGDVNLYRYAGNNPVHIRDPQGEAIWFAIPIIWGAVEVGLSIYDAYDTADTLFDPCKTAGEKWLAGGLFVAGALLPGGGYSVADDIITSKPVKEGIYEFVDKTGKKYVGQSNDIPRRLKEHVKSGKLDPNTRVDVKSMPGSSKTQREVAEHKRIQEITGGVPARQSDKVSNKKDPIGPNRQHLLDD